jgi:hypothetical protein
MRRSRLRCPEPGRRTAATATDGARTTFDRPSDAVYAASKAILEAEQQTSEWKELQIQVDDPAAGVLIAERRLAGAIPGLAVRDLWSFYVQRVDDAHTQVRFVIESSDRPKAAAGARSWAQGKGTIFPAMRRILSEAAENAEPPPQRSAGRATTAAAVPDVQEREPIAKPTPVAKPAATKSAPAGARTGILDRVAAALQHDPSWQATTRERTHAGDRLVLVGAWAS